MVQRWMALGMWGCLLGCAGTNTGNPVEPGGETSGEGVNHGPCMDTTHQLASLDEVSELGLSGAQMLELTEGSSHTDLRWLEPAELRYGPEQNTQTLTVAVRYMDGPIAYVERNQRSAQGDGRGGPEPAVGAVCSDRLQVDVQVHLATAGGALDERFVATLVAKDAGEARIRATLDWQGLAGSLQLHEQTGTLAPYTPTGLALDIVFSDAGLSGELHGHFEHSDGETASHTRVLLARWPDE